MVFLLLLLNNGKSDEFIMPDEEDEEEEEAATRGSSFISMVLVESGEGLYSLEPFDDISRLCSIDVLTTDL